MTFDADDDIYNTETNVFDLKTLFTLSHDRLCSILKERYRYNISIKRGQNFLLNHINARLDLVIMYVDLVDSTKMSMTLPVDKLVTIISAFSHELSLVVESYNGFVLKYAGDAIISFFPSEFDKYLICNRAYRCAKSMIRIVREGINPILSKCDCPELQIKIGMVEGENVVMQYGYDKNSQIDLIGYVMNMASKITSITQSNKISIGDTIYKLLHQQIQAKFEEISLDKANWKYVNLHTGEIYIVYTSK